MFLSTILIATVLFAKTTSADVRVYRVYNPNSGEHLYTAGEGEYNSLVVSGWTGEGIGWYAPNSGNPVYRLYSPQGVHFYTVSSYERDSLVKAGWRYESIAFNSGGSTPIYRAYNPNNGQHNFTSVQYEQKSLVAAGWKDEGVPFYGAAGTATASGYILSWDLVVNKQLLVNSTNSKWSRYFTTGISKWNAVRPNTAYQVNNTGNNIVMVSDYYEVTGIMASTFPPPPYVSSFNITVNDYQFNQVSENSRIEAITHELGHALGLDHYPSKGDLMYNINYGNTTNLSSQNIAQFKAAAGRY